MHPENWITYQLRRPQTQACERVVNGRTTSPEPSTTGDILLSNRFRLERVDFFANVGDCCMHNDTLTAAT